MQSHNNKHFHTKKKITPQLIKSLNYSEDLRKILNYYIQSNVHLRFICKCKGCHTALKH